MGEAGAATKKARAEVENVIDELVQTIQNGVSHPDGTPGFRDEAAEELRGRLRVFAGTIMDAARHGTRTGLDGAVDRAVDTIGEGVIQPAGSGGFGASEAAELRTHLRTFAEATIDGARSRSHRGIDEAIDGVVRTVRSGLFLVYGREPYAAITADQLEAYLETFVDAVLTVVEKDVTTVAARPDRG